MLDAKTNRLDYGEQLIPPDSSYELDFAVGTTYSLDLEAIMILPVAMFYSRQIDSSPDISHLDVFDAITQSADKIRVYCQKGKIKVPKQYNRLMSYWEKGIVELRMESPFSSFHPKVWVVRFAKKGQSSFYRLLITSRNLTNAHDWDVAYSSDGQVGDKLNEKNKPLIDFLKYLKGADGKAYPKGFLEDLAKVNFDLPENFDLMNFHPIGIANDESKRKVSNPIAKSNWDNLLVVSPFVDQLTIESLSKQVSGGLAILSRKEELDKINFDLIPHVSKDHIFQFSELIKEAELQEGICDGNPLQAMLQNLHAKIFIGSKDNASFWFLGSANCTQPAFLGRNVEFMVELKSYQKTLGPLNIEKALTECVGGQYSLFEKYTIEARVDGSSEKSLDSKLRRLIYDLTGLAFDGEVSQRIEGEASLFDLTIKCDAETINIDDDFEVNIKPIAENAALPKKLISGQKNQIINFKGYSLLQLSPYLVVDIVYMGAAIKSFVADMRIDLPDDRMDAVFRSIIDDKEKFQKYLSFLLGGTTVSRLGLNYNRQGDTWSENSSVYTESLYENLLVAASRKPEKLKAVERIVNRLKNDNSAASDILTADFLELWEVFESFLQLDKK